jgi:AraC-like DNA-binding protein
MNKSVFSSAHLPQELSDRQRHALWCGAFQENFSPVEFELSEAPFEARIDFVQLGDVGFAHMFGSFSRAAYGCSRSKSPGDRFTLVTNRCAVPMQLTHAGRETSLPFGASVLLSDDLPGEFTTSSTTSASFMMRVSRRTVLEAVPHADDLCGVPLSPDCEAQRMMGAYSRLLAEENGFEDPLLRGHISKTLIDLLMLALGTCPDTAAVAREGGLRAARLDAILREIRGGHLDPNFCVAGVARKLRLSERYVQDLLQGTGSGFSERVIDLRLQSARQLIDRTGDTHRKISDIAYSSGFNDLSYFHRCFRRRFGMTPAGARLH